ncbi:hypothetical protein [Pseudomonas syringae]|uniref:hypothetical protein n=1 Tax=Pseudomonas syringae TaxID=317 RepID=UPI000760A071|nr:hypothetical protein [Pseudomonas syringae]KWS41647.1 hypothetical protein AL060_17630 [Pseudomonas syringae pv. rhaphiolepidis]
MNIDYAEDWPFCPTEEQMLKQHAHLVAEENRLLRDEVDRYRKLMRNSSLGSVNRPGFLGDPFV